MPDYYVNKKAQIKGDHEVHESTGCPHPANVENREDLGWHASCFSAVTEAKRRGYASANGCAYCSPACHTS